MGFWNKLFGEVEENNGININESKITDAIDRVNTSEIVLNSYDNSFNGFFFTTNSIKDQKNNEEIMVQQYREYSQMSEVEDAITDIINEAIVADSRGNPVKIDIEELLIDNKDVTKLYKDKIPERFKRILNIMNFDDNGYDYIKSLYVDGRIYVYVEYSKNKGIENIRFLDFLKIKKVKDDSGDTKYHYEYDTGEVEERTNKPIILKLNKKNVFYFTCGITDKNGMVISHLHKAIRPINNLRMMENSLIVYRFSRAPERLLFKINTTGMSKDDSQKYINDMIANHRNRTSIDSVTGEISAHSTLMAMQENYWFATKNGNEHSIETIGGGCLHMDTKVDLLDGRSLSIREIEDELKNGKILWTYSCHPETGAVVPGIISWAGVTQKSAKVMKITLDNGEEIICTHDHKFPVYHEGFKRADELQVNSSLIPLYKKNNKICNNTNDYEMIFDNEEKEWKFTHRMVADYLKNDLVKNYVYKEGYNINKFNTRHHKDFNRFNNSPENLYFMNSKDHQKLHSDLGFTYEQSIYGSQKAKEKFEYMKNNEPEKYREFCNEISKRSKQWWVSLSEEEKSEIRQKMSIVAKDINSIMWGDDEKSKERRINHKKIQKLIISNNILCFIIDLIKNKTTHEFTINDVISSLNENKNIVDEFKNLNKEKNVPNYNIEDGFRPNFVKKVVKDFGYKNWIDFRKKEGIHNHRIVKIEYLQDEIEVGTLTIDNDEKYHNYHTFALSCGIFTKNSNLGIIDDILYFQKKMRSSLNVPNSRYEEGSQFSWGRTEQISRDEQKFFRFVKRFRRSFELIFHKLLEIDLIHMEIAPVDDWNMHIKNGIDYIWENDSVYEESSKLSKYLSRAESAESFMNLNQHGFYSKEWIRRNILLQTDDDIEQMKKEIEEEIKKEPKQEEGVMIK